MQFSDTSTKQGLLQDCEFWCGLPDGAISGSTLLRAQFTRLINVRYAKTLGKLQILSGKDGAEDINYTKEQFSHFNIESGVSSYQFLTDQAGNTITDITGILVLPSATATDFVALDRLTLSDTDALLIMSPNASKTGTPTGFIEKNNVAYFDYIPNYDATEGGKVFYRLVPSYFTASDTTKTPGFVEHFHRILSLGASYDWLCVNKPDESNLLAHVVRELDEMTQDLATYIQQKNPTRRRMTARVESSR